MPHVSAPAVLLSEIQRHPTSLPALAVGAALGLPIAALVSILLIKGSVIWTLLLIVAVIGLLPVFVLREPTS